MLYALATITSVVSNIEHELFLDVHCVSGVCAVLLTKVDMTLQWQVICLRALAFFTFPVFTNRKANRYSFPLLL